MTKEKSPCLFGGQTSASSFSDYYSDVVTSDTFALCNHTYYSEEILKSQEKFYTESIPKFTRKKSFNLVLADAYKNLDLKSKYKRVSECGNFLEFRQDFLPSGSLSEMRLHNANFCRDRLCPMCSWRRTLKIYAQVSQLVDFLKNDYQFLFLTLTVPNCSAEDLSATISRIFKSFSKLMRLKKVKKCVFGYFRALEVSISKGEYNLLTKGTYHPHLHIILAVKPSYFKKDYIKHSEWLKMWRDAYQDQNIKNVNIQVCKPKKDKNNRDEKSLSSAIAEVAKYMTKDADYLDCDKNDILHRVQTLNNSLKGRRLVQYGGCFYNAFKKLGLSDVESAAADLLNVGAGLTEDVSYMLYRYEWGAGFYNLVSAVKHLNLDINFEE